MISGGWWVARGELGGTDLENAALSRGNFWVLHGPTGAGEWLPPFAPPGPSKGNLAEKLQF